MINSTDSISWEDILIPYLEELSNVDGKVFKAFVFFDEEEPDIVAWMPLPEPYEVNANDNV